MAQTAMHDPLAMSLTLITFPDEEDSRSDKEAHADYGANSRVHSLSISSRGEYRQSLA